jgi:hypothetical protein
VVGRNPQPEHSFRIYPLNTRLYFNVHIFKTLKDLRQHIRQIGKKEQSRIGTSGVLAMVVSEVEVRQGKLQPLLGEILFCKNYLYDSIVTHELAHAMLRLIERKGWTDKLWDGGEYASDKEEAACYAIGRMAAKVNSTLRDLYGEKLAA